MIDSADAAPLGERPGGALYGPVMKGKRALLRDSRAAENRPPAELFSGQTPGLSVPAESCCHAEKSEEKFEDRSVGKGITMFLIAGLGNPAKKYEKTRHNIGFDVIDAAAARYHVDLKKKNSREVSGSGQVEGQKVLLVKPQTFMNLSGDCIAPLLRFYKIDPKSGLIVISDDISLEPGQIRIRKKGSSGGHNGLKDIIAKTGTDVFARIRIGVGEKPDGWDLADYVLSRFSTEDRKKVDAAVGEAVDALAMIVSGQTDAAMNRYNRRKNHEAGSQGPAS